MDIRDFIRTVLSESPVWTQNKLGARLGLSNQSMHARMAKSGDAKVGFAVDALEALGYRLVAVPEGVRLPAGSTVIGRGE